MTMSISASLALLSVPDVSNSDLLSPHTSAGGRCQERSPLDWLRAAGESGTRIPAASGVVVGSVAVAGAAGASWAAGTALVVARSKNRSSSTGKGIPEQG
jgi:hypothetical protein